MTLPAQVSRRYNLPARFGLFVLLALASATTLWQSLLFAEAELLQRDANHSAIRWAEHVSRNVPDIDFILDGDAPSPVAQEHLAVLRQAGDIFRFDLFSKAGGLRLRSESLSGLNSIDVGVTDPIARGVAQSGAAHSETLHGDGHSRPTLIGVAYVPILLGGSTHGVARLEVNHTTQVRHVRAAFAVVTTAVSGILLCWFAAAFWALGRYRRTQQIAEERVHFLAYHDPLTGAANRTAFRQHLKRACSSIAGKPRLAVLCIDLDHFKDVNDALGHAAGDEMLRQVTLRLASLVRNGDVVARLGGDEFAVLQAGVSCPEDVATLADRIAIALAEPYELAGQRVNGGASVGAAIHGIDGKDPESLLQHADAALYAAKANGRRTYAFFDPTMDGQRNHRRRLTQDLRATIDSGGLSMEFQPLYENDGSTVRGFEALARWNHPVLGLISPAEFVPLAEETGLIAQLGRWALWHACEEASKWPVGLSVAVNLSPAQFRDGVALIADVREALTRASLAPERLEIEVTESLLIGDTENALRCLHEIHDLGVRVALDDFGTGYSSLAYLWQFPFDKVKIDRSFTQGLGHNLKVTLIVKSIVSLAHELHIRVNAEGIETEEQLAMLKDYGCDELQGFLLGRPAAVDSHVLNRQSLVHSALLARTDFAPLDTRASSL